MIRSVWKLFNQYTTWVQNASFFMKIQKQGLAIIPNLHIDVVDTQPRQGEKETRNFHWILYDQSDWHV